MQLVTLEEPAGAGGQPLFVEFVNTLHWYEGMPVELIGTEADFAAWCAEQHLPVDNVTGWLPRVHRFRENVRGLTVALADRQALPEADLGALNAALGAASGNLTLGSEQPRLSFATEASDEVVFGCRVALSLALFLRSPQRYRLKLCANPGCGFAFVDTSINNTRRWCFMRYCGNRLKVRAFRKRKAPAQTLP